MPVLTDPAVTITDVSFSYLPGVPVFSGLSLEFTTGATAVVGANGSGKSTLARLLNGLIVPETGVVTVFGDPTSDRSRLPAIRAAVGMVFQNPVSQMVAPTVAEDIAFGPGNLGLPRNEIRERVDEVVQRLGIAHLVERQTTALSGGEQQLVAVAGAIAMRPRLLVLDEATSSLDPRSRTRLLAAVDDLRRERVGIVSVTHRMEEALASERVIVLSHGAVVFDGPPDELFSRALAPQRAAWSLDSPAVARVASFLCGHGTRCRPSDLTAPEAAAAEVARVAASAPGSRLAGAGGGAVAPPTPDQAARAPRETEAPGAPPASVATPAIAARTLSYQYDRALPPALSDVDFTLGAGEVHAVLGASGSGKSTLVLLLAALASPSAGSIEREAGVVVAPVFQNPEDGLFARTVAEDVAFGPKARGLPAHEVARRVEESLAAVRLPVAEFGERGVLEMSGGEKRRAAIAGVLALDPAVLLLDEPTSGLDPIAAADLRRILRSWVDERPAGRAALLVTHDAAEALELADRATVLASGRVAASGPAPEVIAAEDADGARPAVASGIEEPYHVAMWRELARAGVVSGPAPRTVEEALARLGPAAGPGFEGAARA